MTKGKESPKIRKAGQNKAVGNSSECCIEKGGNTMGKNKEISKIPGTAAGKKQDSLSLEYSDGNDSPLVALPGSEDATFITTGFHSEVSTQSIIENVLSTLLGKMEITDQWRKDGNKILSMMAELNPRDGYEGMLVSQMLTTFDRAMYCFRMADNNKSFAEMYFRLQNQGIKLMRLYAQQLESLDKHRNKGKQKMTVEHIHVNDGGQAVIGNISRGGGGGSKK